MDWDGQERKKFPRAILPCKIIIDYLGKTITTQTENIGKGGIKLLLEEELDHSSIVGLILDIAKDKSIKCEGQIIWVRKIIDPSRKETALYSTGVMFTTISKEDRRYIKDFVERLLANKEKGKQDITPTQ